ncbi:MAG: hypothetical protein O3C21_03670 [Verrucomicrobia bacterium]|nr:hypothetical protein [Verrucomicrobiota bacterium]
MTEPDGQRTRRSQSAVSGDGLTFEWADGRNRQRLRIAFFLIIALIVHAGFFYLFRVVYPTTRQSLPMPSRVLLLSENNLAMRALLAEVEDRTAAYDPSLGSTVGSAQLSDYTTYQPSFAGHELELKDPPVGVANRLPLPDAFAGPPLLPTPTKAPLLELPRRQLLPPGPTKPALAFGGDLAKRELVSTPDLAGIFSESSDVVATYTLAVDAAGIVQSCLPDQDFQADQSEALRRAASQADLKALGQSLYQLRFKSTGGTGLTWGFTTVEW